MRDYWEPVLEEGNTHFGIKYLFPYQRLAIHNILAACGFFGIEEETEAIGDQIVLLPTGAGKSFCFQLPSLFLDGLTLVVYPLLSLMADQHRRLREANIAVGVLQGSQKREEREEMFQKVQSGGVKILLTNPETLLAEKTLKRFTSIRVIHFVVDEAHCIAQWGTTFRPAYLELDRIRATIRPKVTTAFTATASPSVLDTIKKHLFSNTTPHLISANPDRPNIHYQVVETLSKHRTLRLLFTPSSPCSVERPGLVFCRTRKRTELLALHLRRCLQEEVFFYHAGLTREEKKRIEQWFFQSTQGILVATTAYGMGVDKSNIRTVIHEESPSTVEAYLQESGRGGRDTLPSKAILFVSEEDRNRASEFFLGYCSSKSCRRTYLYKELGMELEGCAGCDICHNYRSTLPEGQAAILGFIQRNRRRYTEEEAIRLLRNKFLAAEWRQDELKEAFYNLRGAGKVREGRYLWKQRLY